MPSTSPTRLLIMSGPSGAGKSTVVKRLLDNCPLPIELSVSATTRPPRQGEVDGVDYVFIDHETFEAKRKAGEFLECMEVFGRGHWYGTLKSTVESGLAAGKWMLLEIDVKGALSIVDRFPEVITFFIHPGSLEILEARLRSRGTEKEEEVQRRLEVANQELALSDRYRFTIVNDDATKAAAKICQILQQGGTGDETKSP